MMDSLISVIVPIYKVENFLCKCVDSILNQTYKNLEIILVDDGSPDKCGEICDEYAKKDSRIKVIHKENGGLSDARNAGIDVAQGDYFVFVDSDDYIDYEMIETLYYCIKNDNSDLALCSFTYVDEEGKEICERKNKSPIKNEIISTEQSLQKLCEIKNWYYIVAWNKLYKKEIFNNLRFPKGKINEDEFTIHHIFNKCRYISCVEKPLYYYLQRSGSIMKTKTGMKALDSAEALYDRTVFAMENDIAFLAYYSIRAMSRVIGEFIPQDDASQKRKSEVYKLYVDVIKKMKFKNLSLKKKLIIAIAKICPMILILKNGVFR